MSRILSLLRSSGVQAVVSSSIVLLLTVLAGVLSARLLRVEDRGIAAALLALGATLSQAGNAGPAETQLIAPLRGYSLGTTIRITWFYSLCITLLAAIPAIAYLNVMSRPDSLLITIVATAPASATVGLMCNYLLLGEKRYGASALLRTLPIVLQTMALIGIWLLDIASVTTVLLANWLAGLLAGCIGLGLAKPWVPPSDSLKGHWGDISKMILRLGGSHSLRIVGYRLDLILLGALAGGHAAGLYSVAISLTMAGNSLIANLTPLVTTREAGVHSARFTQVSSLFAACIAIGIAVIGPLLIPLVYGKSYAPGRLLVGVLAVSMYGSFLLDATSRIFQRNGYERIALRVSVVVIAVQISAISAGALTAGAVGAALGNLIAYGCGIAALFVVARRCEGIEPLGHQFSALVGLRVVSERLLSR